MSHQSEIDPKGSSLPSNQPLSPLKIKDTTTNLLKNIETRLAAAHKYTFGVNIAKTGLPIEKLKEPANMLTRLTEQSHLIISLADTAISLAETESRFETKAEKPFMEQLEQKPPYNLEFYENLLRKSDNAEKDQIFLGLAESMDGKGMKEEEERFNSALAEMHKQERLLADNKDESKQEKLKWQLELSTISKELAEAGFIIEQLKYLNVKKQLQIFRLQKKNNSDLLAHVSHYLQIDAKKLEKIIQKISKKGEWFSSRIDKLKAEADDIRKSFSQAQEKLDAASSPDEKAIAQANLTERQAWLETYESVLRHTEKLKQYTVLELEIWQYRFGLLKGEQKLDQIMRWKDRVDKVVQDISRTLALEQSYQASLQEKINTLSQKIQPSDSASQITIHLANQLHALEKLAERRIEYLDGIKDMHKLGSRFLFEVEIFQKEQVTQQAASLSSSTIDNYGSLSSSVEQSIALERENLEKRKEQLWREEGFQKAMDAHLNSYKIQISSYSNLLLIYATEISELRKTRKNCLKAILSLNEKFKQIQKNGDEIAHVRLQAIDQNATNEKQLAEIRIATAEDNNASANLFIKNMELLAEIFSQKLVVLESISTLYSKQADRYNLIRKNFEALTGTSAN